MAAIGTEPAPVRGEARSAMDASLRILVASYVASLALASLSACSNASQAAEREPASTVAERAGAHRSAATGSRARRRREGAALPRPAHVVVIVEENHTLAQIVGSGSAPYIDALVRRGALFTHATGVTHPSLPNYLALFAGVTNDNGDGCPATGFSPAAPNLASELHAAGLSFAGYAEAMPGAGSHACAAGTYARKHAPWVAFSNVPPGESQPFDRAARVRPSADGLVPRPRRRRRHARRHGRRGRRLAPHASRAAAGVGERARLARRRDVGRGL